MLSAIKNRLISLLQLILVIIYVIFEELIWDGIAKPIYEFVHALKVLQKVERKLQSVNASVILIIFLVLFIIVEAFGIYAGMLFVSGQVMLGLTLYIAKIPIAAFTFWLFRVTEDKLMEFEWFKWLYELIVRAIAWLKSKEVYIKSIAYLKVAKQSVKNQFKSIKSRYFSKQSPFVAKMKHLYQAVKESLKK
ncbi:MAG: hypothetical protein U9O24_04020 [Campylobacterota bacterium]|nr:hypothetical protein [Campylobacterota bacterium]